MSICEEVEDKSKALGFAATIRRSQEGGRVGRQRKKNNSRNTSHESSRQW
jgi:hypothetical protein